MPLTQVATLTQLAPSYLSSLNGRHVSSRPQGFTRTVEYDPISYNLVALGGLFVWPLLIVGSQSDSVG